MLYKEDWENAKNRMTAWWDGESTDSPLIQVWAPRTSRMPDSRILWELARNPSDPEGDIDLYEKWFSRVYFGGAAYPNLWINLGAGVLGAYLGAKPRFMRDTVWFGAQWSNKFVKDWDELSDITLEEGNEWWQYTKRVTKMAAKRGKSKFVVGMTDLGGIADVIASLRGPQNLIADLYRNKKEVANLSGKLVEIWHRCYEDLLAIIREEMPGSSAWMGIWSPRKWYPTQSDFSAMLSPKLFDELVLPYLREQFLRLDDPLYHLDGPGQLCLVDSLLKTPELKAIQWVPGAGEDNQGHHCGSRKWYPLYRKILSRGRRLVLSMPQRYIVPIIKELGSKGILFQTTTRNILSAKRLLKSSSGKL